jgi:hypothetical protein
MSTTTTTTIARGGGGGGGGCCKKLQRRRRRYMMMMMMSLVDAVAVAVAAADGCADASTHAVVDVAKNSYWFVVFFCQVRTYYQCTIYIQKFSF